MRWASTDLLTAHYQLHQRYVVTNCMPPPSPSYVAGMNLAVTFFPGSFHAGEPPMMKDMLNCIIGILERLGDDEAAREGFRAWQAICYRKA